MTKKILLKFIAKDAGEPIIAGVILETKAKLNILTAEVSEKGGIALMAVPKEDVAKVMKAFRERGVEAKEAKATVDIDREKCVDCGFCVSVCPPGALSLKKDELHFEPEKCIGCRLCLSACSVSAIKEI